MVAAMLFGNELRDNERKPMHIGCIAPECAIEAVVHDAYDNASFLCDQYYLASPKLNIQEYNGNHYFIYLYQVYFFFFKSILFQFPTYHFNYEVHYILS